jgi:hypothetical protein
MRSRCSHVLSGLALLACSTLATSARGDTPPALVLTWSAPSHCPEEGEFRALVEGFLRQSLDERRQQNIVIAGALRQPQESGDFQLQLRVETAVGQQTRELSHRDCRELAEAGALVAALAIDPSLVGQPPPPRPPEAPAAAVIAVGQSPAEVPRTTTKQPVTTPAARAVSQLPEPQRASPSWHPSLIGIGVAGNGVLPGVGVGMGARAAAGRERWRVAIRGAYWLERFEPLPGSSGSGLALSTWSIGLRACGLPVVGRISLWVCLGPDAGPLRAEGRELENARSAEERWTAMIGELNLVHTSSSGLISQLGLEVGKALEMPRFGVSQDGREVEVFRANAWILLATAGFGFSFDSPK